MSDLTSSLTGMPLPSSQPDVDPLDDMLATRRDAAISRRIRESDAEKEARVSMLAREYDMPAVVISADLPGFEAQRRAGRAQSVMAQYPAIGKWSNKGNNAAVAADDYDNLSLFGKAFYTAKAVPTRLVAGLYDNAIGGSAGFIRGMAETAEENSPIAWAERELFGGSLEGLIARGSTAVQKWASEKAEPWRVQSGNRILDATLSGVESAPLALGSLATALVAGPQAGAMFAGGTTAGAEYAKARDKGLTPTAAQGYALVQGSVEVLTEKLPVSRLLGDVAAKTPIGKTFLRQLVLEIPGEQAATILQDLNEWVTLNPEKTLRQFKDERADAAIDTLLGTIGGVGSTVAITKAAERTSHVVDKIMNRRAQAVQAQADGAILDNIADAASKSKLATRDPDALADLVQQLGEEAGNDRVFIPAEALRAYEQSDGYSGEFDSYRDAIDEAYATGGDWVVPIGEVTKLAKTPAWAALKDDMRLTPGGISAREAQTFDESMADIMDDLSEQAAQEAEVERAAMAPRETLRQSIADKLMNAGFTPATATQQAELLAQKEATRATRMGRELTGQEFDPVEVNQVLPPALAQIQAADNTDILIETMKGGKDAKTAAGPSLMDFIAKGGGIVDTGGDLKAMGADAWHKGKPGKRKFVRDTIGDGQSSMLADGGLGVNEYGADAWAMRAWEAGYFPEFDERPAVNDLLDAIAEGVAGRDRYLTAQEKTLRDAAQELRGVLENRGIDPDTASRKEIKDAIAAYQRESEGAAFNQSFNDGPRGRIVFPSAGFGQGSSTIELFQSRDQSTFLHEVGHLWLEQLRFDALSIEGQPETAGNAGNAGNQLSADWQAVQDWFAENGHPLADGVIPVEAHELWARGVERYLMEGKAPTPLLRKAFEQFKSWLVAIYRTVDRLKTPITPEIRGVMDRLIATDEEIEAARAEQGIEALFAEKPATMTDEEFAAYQASTEDARGAAHDALLAKVMNAVKRRVTKEYKDRREAVAVDVAAQIDARPEFRALRQARSTPLDSEWIRDALGEDAPAMLPKNVPPVHKANGANPDEVAELSGFTSGDEMVRALMGVETARRQLREGGDQRSVRQALIDQEVDALMMERYGDPFTDGSIEEEALAIIHNDQQGEVIAAEMRVLARSTGQRVTPYRIAKDWAARTVRGGRVADVASRASIQRYQRAAAKAGKAAMDAVIAGDNAEAFRQKQAQMLNNALVSEAKRAADAIEGAVKRMSKVASKRTMASVDQDYLERAQGLLEQVDLKQRSQRFLDRQESFEGWAREQEEAGRDMIVPPSFAATLGTTNWSRLTVDQLLGLDEAVKQIMHLGRLKQTLLDAKEERDYEAVVGDAVAQIDELVESGGLKPPKETRTFVEPGYFSRAKNAVLSFDASLLKMETVFDWLDGGKFGVFKRVVFQRMVDAQERRRKMTVQIVDAIAKAQAGVPKEVRKRWSQKVTMSFIDPRTGRPAVMTRDQLISMALNMGNEGNAKKLAGGYGWNEQSILDMLNRELTAGEWQYVQKVWDAIDVLWADIAALERRVNGVEPDKVEAREVQTSAGMLRGGYYPVVYDGTRDLRVEKQGALSADQLFSSAYKRANTRAGSNNERTEVQDRPILLSPAVLSRHVNEVVHDITHREALIDAHRFLNDARIVGAVRNVLGEEIQKQFNHWLQHIANEFAYDAQGMGAIEKGLKAIRTNATFVGLAYRASTIMLQITGFIQTAEVIGAGWMAKGIYSFTKNPGGSYRFVLENSQEVAARMETMDRDMREMLNAQSRLGKGVSALKANGFALIGVVDRFVSVVSWIAAYNKAQARNDGEAQSIAYADEVVRKSQGSGSSKDLVAIMRGKGNAGEAMKMIAPFYSFMSAYYQRQRTLARDYGAAFRTKSIEDFPGLMSRTIMLYVLPVLATAWLKGDGPDDDDEESYTRWLLGAIGTNALGPIPLVRDIANFADKGFGGDVSAADRFVGSASRVVTDIKNIWEGGDTKRATRNAMEVAGYAGAPTSGQMAATSQFLVDVFAGDQHPETFGDWLQGLKDGKIKED